MGERYQNCDETLKSRILKRLLQPRKYIKSALHFRADQNIDVQTGESPLEDAARQRATKCEEKNKE